MENMALKIGIMLNGVEVRSSLNSIIDRILDNPNTELKLVILNEGNQLPQKPTLFQKLFKNNFLYHRYLVWERRRIAGYLVSLSNRNISNKIKDIPCLNAIPIEKNFSHGFDQKDVAKIKEYQLDIILQFGFDTISGEILNAARFGVWRFYHGDNDEYSGGPAGFWEVYENNPLSGVTLQVLTEKLDGDIVLNKINRRTDFTSVLRNTYSLQQTGVTLLLDTLNFVAQQNFTRDSFFLHYPQSSNEYSKKEYREPKNWEMIIFFGKLIFRFFQRKIYKKNKREQWTIGIIQEKAIDLNQNYLENVNWYVPDESRFVADPFILKRNGKIYLLVEDFIYEKNRGHIAVMEMDEKGNFSEPYPILLKDFHLSFPFVFEHDHNLYMVPEQSQSNQIVLYQCMDFPRVWEEKKVLFDNFPAVDTVLYFYRNKWWLFTTRFEPCNNENNLFIYHANSLWEDWKPHALNPVKTDIRGSRMAGSIFLKDGKLIRPAQNGLKRYGGSVIFYEILILSEDEYKEQRIYEIFPEKASMFNEAFHTSNSLGKITAVDGSRRI